MWITLSLLFLFNLVLTFAAHRLAPSCSLALYEARVAYGRIWGLWGLGNVGLGNWGIGGLWGNTYTFGYPGFDPDPELYPRPHPSPCTYSTLRSYSTSLGGHASCFAHMRTQ
ncbi:uncharacterized protein LAJ45_05902 [Morchella importuna]|uniref:uncharacterized protein n=1 Tax=Morchella importuna TaxID=1174673 RepID=UPI001E8DF22A|nr:uncharacterized protein LAJ45_05902 [Morchella importuna]KAH8150216.1 hypothetical protein LAJ45_05902 [Morchella importuna]